MDPSDGIREREIKPAVHQTDLCPPMFTFVCLGGNESGLKTNLA
jgi:hypothetical protein